ncbi:MAG: VanW family protein [Patescibacteria group bacterium]|nr:VanW family protein [Patescibacteria group bacterium]
MAKSKKPRRKKYQRSTLIREKEGLIYEDKTQKTKTSLSVLVFFFLAGCILGLFILFLFYYLSFEKTYQGKVYPGITIAGVDLGGKSPQEVQKYFIDQNNKFKNLRLTFSYENFAATASAAELNLGYNAKLLSDQAYLLGRSGNFFSDLYLKLFANKNPLQLSLSVSYDQNQLQKILTLLAGQINIAPQNALFRFENNRVVSFQISKNGRRLNQSESENSFRKKADGLTALSLTPTEIDIPLTVNLVKPEITTDRANDYGIKELIGSGTSTFYHSIENRVYNISLAASRLNGVLIAPGETFSFNRALGDISAFTGYKQAYIIKDGKTILGDGGGVCQVSTTLFRSALNAGLPIVERWAHAYRVGYYEQDSPPGIDATVYSPTNDLKIKNDTGHYILVQAITDTANYRLTFDLYGQKDNRHVTLTKPVVWDQTPAPPDLYQDDPALPKGEIKQVDFSAWGAKASFDYKVERNGQVIFQKTFYSNYQPWQAVYLRGIKE